MGVARKSGVEDSFSIEESLGELTQLADTAGLMVVGSTYQKSVQNYTFLFFFYFTSSLLMMCNVAQCGERYFVYVLGLLLNSFIYCGSVVSVQVK